MATAQKDYYEVLGVARDADADGIKAAFRKLAMEYHPDRNKAPEAADRFKEIAEAYGILSDPDKRAQYDAGGFAGVAGFSPEDLFSGIDFGDIFGGMGHGFDFGGGLFDRLFRHHTGPARGRDLEVLLPVALETIATGGQETVRYRRERPCETCSGSGAKPGTEPRACEACSGSGQHVVTRGEKDGFQFRQVSTCPKCRGQGQIIDTPCPECGGSGRSEVEETLKVTIPRGAEEGLALRVAGHGYASADPNAPPGDLYVIVRSKPDPRFQRAGSDLWRSESLPVADAVLGTQLRVPTLDHDVDVTVPSGTQPDAVLRLRGKGLPRFGVEGHGDLNIRINVEIPAKLSRRERSLYEELRSVGHKASSWFSKKG